MVHALGKLAAFSLSLLSVSYKNMGLKVSHAAGSCPLLWNTWPLLELPGPSLKALEVASLGSQNELGMER